MRRGLQKGRTGRWRRDFQQPIRATCTRYAGRLFILADGPRRSARKRASGSGGGISKYFSKPSYQAAVTQSTTKRTSPDVGYVADPSSGVSVYDATNGGWSA